MARLGKRHQRTLAHSPLKPDNLEEYFEGLVWKTNNLRISTKKFDLLAKVWWMELMELGGLDGRCHGSLGLFHNFQSCVFTENCELYFFMFTRWLLSKWLESPSTNIIRVDLKSRGPWENFLINAKKLIFDQFYKAVPLFTSIPPATVRVLLPDGVSIWRITHSIIKP